MRLSLGFLLLLFVVTIFTPSIVCQSADEAPEAKLETDTKTDKVDDGFSVADNLSGEDYRFQAEINQLMKIIINSLYSNREIFLRELVSNAADALSKARFLSLTDKDYLGSTSQLEIKIKLDPENNQLHIRDTGVGMTKQELINNLGSIAKSGTKEFLDKLKGSGSDISTIGQFGVGFYSSFLVADKVTVTSKHNDDEQYIWESTASETTSFTVAKDPRGNTLGRGTLITLHLKEDASEFLNVANVKSLLVRYNEFISFPILVWNSRTETRTVEQEATPQTEEQTDETEIKVEEDNEEEETETKPTTSTETVWDWERVNVNAPLWTRPKNEVTEEEYKDFYKNVLKGTEDPLYYTHFKAEGDAEFKSLIYIPKKAAAGVWETNYKPEMKLYVKRVFITDNFSEMLPKYLNFIRGIVDSDDISLNVSREMLQQSKNLGVIKKKLVRKIIAMLQELAQNEPEKYEQFIKEFGPNIKYGLTSDLTNRDRLSKLIRFPSSKSPEKYISFEDYVNNFRKGQEEIYYIGGESMESAKNSPYLERLTKKGYDVLLLTDPIDEYAVSTIGKYDGKYKLTDITKEGFKLSDDDEQKKKDLTTEFEPLATYLKEKLSDHVSKVEVSLRLTKTPATIAASSWGYSANMERIMKAQALRDERFLMRVGGKRVLEINPNHPVIKQLLNLVKEEKTDATTEDIAHLLFDTAVLNSGYGLEQPMKLTNRVTKLVSTALDLDPNQPVPEEEEEPVESKSEQQTQNEDSTQDENDEDVATHEEL